jgi:hypothetical protein
MERRRKAPLATRAVKAVVSAGEGRSVTDIFAEIRSGKTPLYDAMRSSKMPARHRSPSPRSALPSGRGVSGQNLTIGSHAERPDSTLKGHSRSPVDVVELRSTHGRRATAKFRPAQTPTLQNYQAHKGIFWNASIGPCR